MPNWNDPKEIRKWLDSQEKGKQPPRLRDLKPAPRGKDKPEKKGNAWRRNLEESKPKPKKIGPEVKSTYSAEEYDYDPDRESVWQRKDELPNEQGGYDDPYRIAPDTNYQALPRFVTEKRRNPAGGYAGVKEARGFIDTVVPPVVFGSADPAWEYYRTPPTWYDNKNPPTPQEGDPRYFQASDFLPYGAETSPVEFMDNPPWGYGPAAVEYQQFRQNWRPANDLWRRIRDADIVPYGQQVPLGEQMHPSFGPVPQSGYMDLNKYNFRRA